MGTEVLTRCAYRCDLCHAYKNNIEKDDQRQLLSDGWHIYITWPQGSNATPVNFLKAS
jgi:hypothetical protein